MDCNHLISVVCGIWIYTIEKIYRYVLSDVKPDTTDGSEAIYRLQIIQ